MFISLTALAILTLIGALVGLRTKLRPSPLPTKLSSLITMIILSAGAWVTLAQGPIISQEIEVSNWPQTGGLVISSATTGERNATASITYEYTLDDITHTANVDMDISGFGSRKYRGQTARNVIADYPAGTEVTVHYEPENPANSTLRPGLRWAPLTRLAFGAMLFGIGVALGLRLLRRFRQATS